MEYKKKKVILDEQAAYKGILAYSIGIFLILYPFCVYLHIEKLTPLAADFFANSGGYAADFFLYYKEILLICMAVWLILFFLGEQIYPRCPVKDIPLRSRNARSLLCVIGIYLVCLMCSAFHAEDARTAWLGCVTEYEGVLALVSYMVLFLAGYNYFAVKKRQKILQRAVIVLAVFVVVGAVAEYFYQPLYEMDFMAYLISPGEFRELARTLKNEEYQGRAVLAFYNPSYLGGLCVLLLPVILGVGYEKKAAKRLGCLMLSAGLVFTVFATKSTGAYFCSLVGCLIFYLFLIREKKQMFCYLCEFAICLLIFLGVGNFFSNGELFRQMDSVSGNADSYRVEDNFFLTDLVLEGDHIDVWSRDMKVQICPVLNVSGQISGCEVLEETGKKLSGDRKALEHMVFKKAGYGNIEITWENNILHIDFGYKKPVDFFVSCQGICLIGQNGKLLQEIPKSQIQNRKLQSFYPFATGRGYIWVNTLPILKECFLLGIGPGHFAYAFVQNEVVGMLNTHGSYQFVIDKPHCWYLQIWVNTGLISLVCILILLFSYFYGGIRKYVRNQCMDTFEISLVAGIFSFALLGMVNDSMVTVNPIFWLLFGVGYCCRNVAMVQC